MTYIESTPERVWEALTDADVTAEYWGRRNISDWQVGSPWSHDGPAGGAERAAAGWAAVLSNLKSLLETGHVLPGIPWKAPVG